MGDYNRVLDAYRALLGQVPDGEGGLRDMTDAETASAFAEGIFNGLKANVHRKEKDVASKNASDAINEIDLT